MIQQLFEDCGKQTGAGRLRKRTRDQSNTGPAGWHSFPLEHLAWTPGSMTGTAAIAPGASKLEYYPAIKRIKLPIHAIEWMTLRGSLLNEIARTKKLLHGRVHLFNILERATLTRAENRPATARRWSVGRRGTRELLSQSSSPSWLWRWMCNPRRLSEPISHKA